MRDDERPSNETLGQLYDQAVQCYRIGRFEDALILFDAILGYSSIFSAVHVSRGAVLLALGRPGEAYVSFEEALKRNPNDGYAAYSKGVALQAQGRMEDALESYSSATLLDPHLAIAHNNRAFVLRELGRMNECLVSYDCALALNPRCPEFLYGKAVTLLLLGQFEAGLPLYEARKNMAHWQLWGPRLSSPLWTGREPIEGKTMVIQAEQGLGDSIQFCRYAPLLEKRGAKVVLLAQAQLIRLLSSLDSQMTLMTANRSVPAHDYHIPLLSLPLAFDRRAGAVSDEIPYLYAEPSKKALWQPKLPGSRINIGVCWQGDTASPIDNGRSFALHNLQRIAKNERIRLISLQKHHGVEQLQCVPSGMKIEVLDGGFDEGQDAFIDTAAIISCLDLVITSDTAIAHLAGALGCPTWLALRHIPDWRWQLKDLRSTWYPTMRLFRQNAPGDWEGVFASMESELKKLSC